MSISVATPDGGIAEFPDGMAKDDIRAALRRKFADTKKITSEMGMRERSNASIAPVKEMISNIPGSAANFAHDIVQPIIHPIDTATNLGMIGKGVLQKLGIMKGEDATAHADAVGEFLVKRYGSGEAIKKTLVEDPVGMAADVSMILTGGGAAAARAPGIVGRAGEIAGQVGRAVDPINAAVQGGRAVGEGAGAAGRAITGTQAITPERAASIDYLRGEGVTPMAGQYPTGKGLSRAERTTGSAPASGGAFERESERVAGEFTAAVNRRMGVAAERATPEVIQNVRRDLSQDFEASTRTLRVNFTPALHQNILDWAQEVMRQGLPGDATNRLTQQARNIIQGFQSGRAGRPNHMLGTTYHSMIKKGSPLDNAVHGADADVSRYAMQLRNILDDALEATASHGNATRMGPALELFREARRKWANMVIISKAVSGAGEGTAAGYVSPQRLRAVITGSGDAKLLYAAGRGDLQELARAGNEILTTTSSSGTAENILSHGVVGGLAGGAAIAGTGNLVAGAATAVAPFTPGLAGRALMSGPVQRSLRGDAPAAAPTSTARTLGGQSAFQAGRESQIPPQPGPPDRRSSLEGLPQYAQADTGTMSDASPEGPVSPDIQRLMQQPMTSTSAQRQAMPLGKSRGQTVGDAVTSMLDTAKKFAKHMLMLNPEQQAMLPGRRRPTDETAIVSPLGTTQEDVADVAQMAMMTVGPQAAAGVLRPIMKLAAQHPYIAGNVAGLITTISSSTQASVETDRPAESFEVPLPEASPPLVKSRDTVQSKMDAADAAFQTRAQGSYRTQKAREIDASTHKDAMTGFRDQLREADKRITDDQDKRKRESQLSAKAQADIAAAKAERERPLTDKYPALMALPYLGAAYSGGVAYVERARQMQRYNDWVKRFNTQVANVDKMNQDVEKFGALGKTAAKKAPKPPTGQAIEREQEVLGEYVKGADEAKKIIDPGVAAGAYTTAGRVISGSVIATELAAVPSLIDLATQKSDTKAGQEAQRKLKTLEGWLGTLQSTMTAGLVGASVGGTLPVQKQMMPNMERARVLGQPNALQGAAPSAQPKAGVPPGIMPDAWRQRQTGQSLQ